MWQILLVPLLAVTLAGIAKGQETSQSDVTSVEKIKQEVLKVENERNNAVLHADIALLKRIYTADLVYVNAYGQTLTEAQHLSDLRTGTTKMIALRHDHVRVRVYGDGVGIVTGRSTSVLEYGGKTFVHPRVFTDILVKLNGQWRFTVHHETFVTKQ